MIAYYMKKNTLVSNTWLGEHLYMGRPQGVSQYVSDFGKSKGFETSQYKKMAGRFNTWPLFFSRQWQSLQSYHHCLYAKTTGDSKHYD